MDANIMGAANGHAAVVRLLTISWRADRISNGKSLDMARLGLNEKDWLGKTPLHDAVLANAVEVVKFLVSRDEVDLEATNNKGTTQLQVAQGENLVEITELLLQAQRGRAAKAS